MSFPELPFRNLPRPRRLGPLLLLATVVVWALALLPLLGVASDDARMAGVLQADEGTLANVIDYMIGHRTLAYRWRYYPGLYFNLGAPLAWLTSSLPGVDLHAAEVLVPRALSWLAGSATLVLTGVLALRISGRWIPALVSALLMATTTEFVRLSVMVHPDTIQTATLLGSLLVLTHYVTHGRIRSLILAGVLSGFAFGAKYGGTFMIPFGVLAVVWRGVALSQAEDRLKSLVRDLGLAAAAFALGVAVSFPQLFMEPQLFLDGVRQNAEWAAKGHPFRDVRSGAEWLAVLSHPRMMGLTLTLGFLALAPVALGMGLGRGGAHHGNREGTARPADPGAVFAAVAAAGFALLYLAFLVRGARDFSLRYAMPSVPFAYAFLAGGSSLILAHIGPPRLRRATVAALLLLAGLIGAGRQPVVTGYWAERDAERDAPRFTVGRWLRTHVPSDAAILYDHYTYVPQAFRSSWHTWGLQDRELHARDPDVIITNDVIRHRFRPGVAPSSYKHGAEVFTQALENYAALEAGTLEGYRLVARLPEVDDTRIYAREPVAAQIEAATGAAE